MTQTQSRQLELPASRFYWGIIDASDLPELSSRRRRHEQLGYQFEEVLPQSIGEVQVVYCRLSARDRRYLACAIPLSLLDQHDLGPDVITLIPETIPDCVSGVADSVAPSRLNMLTGPFEPSRISGLKRQRRSLLAIALLALAAVMLIGMERRVRTFNSHSESVEAKITHLYTELIGEPISGQPRQLVLTAERRRLEQTTRQVGKIDALPDVAPDLATVLRAWPRAIDVQVDSIAVTPEYIRIRALVPTPEAAQSLVRALDAKREWRLQSPKINRISTGVQVVITLSRSSQPTGDAS